MEKIIFKFRGYEFRTPSLNGRQKLAVLIFKFTGIRTAEYRHIVRVNRALWKEHCEMMQSLLNEERRRGWGRCYLTDKRVDF